MAITTKRGLPGLFLLVLGLGLGGCDVFVSDAGQEGMPCKYDDDCVDGNICLYDVCWDAWIGCTDDFVCQEQVSFEAFCEHEVGSCLPYSPDGYGSQCISEDDCWDDEDRCVGFLADPERPRCSTTCDPGGGHNVCEDVPGGTACIVTDCLDRRPVCARESWSLQTGILCDPGAQNEQCPEAMQCASFHALQVGVCTETGCVDSNGCRPEMECWPVNNQFPPPDIIDVCGFPTWHGFWMNCGTNEECVEYPGFQECNGFGFCSRACDGGQVCPKGAVCRQDGYCVPDLPEFTD